MELNSYLCNQHFRKIFSTKASDGKPEHIAVFWFIVELNNQLGWIDSFGLPIYNAMEEVKIRNFKTFSKYLNDLHEWGVIEIIAKSTNQHTANIISIKSAMVKLTEPLTEPLTEALPQHLPQHCRSTATINKLINTKNLETVKTGQSENFDDSADSDNPENSETLKEKKNNTPPPQTPPPYPPPPKGRGDISIRFEGCDPEFTKEMLTYYSITGKLKKNEDYLFKKNAYIKMLLNIPELQRKAKKYHQLTLENGLANQIVNFLMVQDQFCADKEGWNSPEGMSDNFFSYLAREKKNKK